MAFASSAGHCLWQGLVSLLSTAGESPALVTARDGGDCIAKSKGQLDSEIQQAAR